jgi:Flp pilus assembly protein TadG
MTKSLQSLRTREEGSSAIELAVILPFLVLMLVAAVDFGRGYYASIEVSSAAEAGALYGTLNLTDTAGMQAAATLDAHDVSGLTAVATYGCECSDGTHAVASCTSPPTTCTSNALDYVQVVTKATYTPILRFPGISTSYPLKSVARMRAGN